MFSISATILFTTIVFGVYLGNAVAYTLPGDAIERDYFEDYEIWKVMGGTFTKRSNPPRNGELNLRENWTWKILFSIPLVLYTIQLLCLTIVHTFETPKWYLLNGDEASAVCTVHEIYLTKDSRSIANKICFKLKNSASIDANKIGFIDAYFKNEFYRRANWVNCVLVIIAAVS